MSALGCTLDGGEPAELAARGFAQFAEPRELAGDASIEFGQPLGNRCAFDVQQAFAALPATPTGKIRYWSRGGSRLPPRQGKLAPFGSWDAHVQSISRLSLPWDDNLWAAVSRSNPGASGGAGVFLVDLGGVRGADGTRWVLPGDNFGGEPPAGRQTYKYYPLSDTDHPGGIQVVGAYLVVAAEGAEGAPPFVEILERVADDADYRWLSRFTLQGDLGEPVAPSRFITAAALTRLLDGRYLLFVLGKDEEQQGWFYVSDQPVLSADTRWSFLDYVAVPGWYQNVTLLTECDSRDVYLLATNNIDFDGSPNSGTDWADLYQVSRSDASGHVELSLIDGRIFAAGGSGYCTFRAAANAYVDRDGALLLYCHAYKANTDFLGSPDGKLKLVEYAPP